MCGTDLLQRSANLFTLLIENGNIRDRLVPDHAGGIKETGEQAVEYAFELGKASEPCLQYARDEDHSDKGQNDAHDLRGRDAFPENKR